MILDTKTLEIKFGLEIPEPIPEAESKILWALMRRFPSPTTTSMLDEFYLFVSGENDKRNMKSTRIIRDEISGNLVAVLIARLNKKIHRLTKNKICITNERNGMGYFLQKTD